MKKATGCRDANNPPDSGWRRHRGRPMIQVVIVDDHELVRTGFRLIIEQQADI